MTRHWLVKVGRFLVKVGRFLERLLYRGFSQRKAYDPTLGNQCPMTIFIVCDTDDPSDFNNHFFKTCFEFTEKHLNASKKIPNVNTLSSFKESKRVISKLRTTLDVLIIQYKVNLDLERDVHAVLECVQGKVKLATVVVVNDDLESDYVTGLKYKYSVDLIVTKPKSVIRDIVDEIFKCVQQKRRLGLNMNFTNGYALLIGVSHRQYPIPIIHNDISGLYQVLTDLQLAAYPETQVFVLESEDATKDKIINAFDQLIEKIGNNDNATVSIYYSGHGFKINDNFALMPYDYVPNDVETAITSKEFIQKIDAVSQCCKKIIVWIDCCHAQSMSKSSEGQLVPNKSPATDDFITTMLYQNSNKLDQGSGKAIITSCTSNQESYYDAHNSIFTKCLLDALKGKVHSPQSDNPYVKLFDVVTYISENVPRIVKEKFGRTQEIVFDSRHLDPNVVICYSPTRNDSVVRTAETNTKNDDSDIKLLKIDEKKLQAKIEGLDIITDKIIRFENQKNNTTNPEKDEELRVLILELKEDEEKLNQEIEELKRKIKGWQVP